MQADIINIGDELLIGQVVNTNASWLGQQLSLAGIQVRRIITIADQRDEILVALEESMKTVQVVLITGGLGPTRDDITKDVLCEFFHTSLVFSEVVYKMIEEFFEARNLSVTELNRGQAYVPASCEVLLNPFGTAPGMWFKKDGVDVISLPGVPHELKPMLMDHVLPSLQQGNIIDHIIHRTILTHGMGESFLAKRIENWETNLPEGIKLAYLPSPGMVRLRLTAMGQDRSKLVESISMAESALHSIIPELIFGYDEERMEEIVGKLLVKSGLTLAIAESCTGGYTSHMITSVPGSSRYFIGSIVAYNNNLKTALLKVDPLLIQRHGAVSEEVVKAMAEGAREIIGSDFAIATSGIAGPNGGTAEKPVGTTWIAVSGPRGTIAKQYFFGSTRERNIQLASLSALNMLRKAVNSE